MKNMDSNLKEGEGMYNLAEKLFPICRSITGNGVRETLRILRSFCAELNLYEIPSGTKVFDWTIPQEWNIKDAFIKDNKGCKIIDFAHSNLHVMGYSIPIHKKIKKEQLLQFIYTEPRKPDVIPYVTSYYKKCFGFCMSENQKKEIINKYSENDEFEICIDSSLTDGFLNYGELLIPGETSEEIFFSTYICHPSMANNELSGPCLAIYLADWVAKLSKRRYTYRFVFIPETIGAITYICKNLDTLKKNVKAGFNLTCLGDDRTYSYVESKYADTLADKVIQNVLKFHFPNYKKYSFLESGSDERRYQAPGVELPVVCFSRSLYGEYPEYHTSADNLSVISPEGLQGSFNVMTKCITALEHNKIYKATTTCEPQLGKRNLYPTVSQKRQHDEVSKLIHILSYADGKNDTIDLSNIIDTPVNELLDYVNILVKNKLIDSF
jgi:aminopeptidase-like protein